MAILSVKYFSNNKYDEPYYIGNTIVCESVVIIESNDLADTPGHNVTIIYKFEK